jgi:hypothetical protein
LGEANAPGHKAGGHRIAACHHRTPQIGAWQALSLALLIGWQRIGVSAGATVERGCVPQNSVGVTRRDVG